MQNRSNVVRRRKELATLRGAAQKTIEDTLQASFGAGRAQTAAEVRAVESARSEVHRIDAELERLADADDQLRAANDDAAGEHPSIRASAAGEARARHIRVGREPRTYEKADIRTSYLRDLIAVSGVPVFGSQPDEARARLQRHAQEVRVELASPRFVSELRADGEDAPAPINYESRALDRVDGSGGEFVPPLWLIEDWVSLSRAARVTANLCNRMPLPGGTDSINVPKVATGATVGMQTADNAAISDTDATTSSVTAAVRTAAGQQDVALQALEQSPAAFDQILFNDLAAAHAAVIDSQVINGSGASGQVLGILNIGSVDTTTYTDASPTVPELYPKIADSANVIATTRFMPPTAVIMHPRRWYWMLSAVDSSNRPFVTMQSQGPSNSLASADPNNPFGEGGPVGQLPFGPVYIDSNVPTNLGAGTNEDVIILTRPQELYLWESPIRTRVLQEPGSATLTTRLQLYNYVAFMPDRRPESTSIVSGTGCTPPTF